MVELLNIEKKKDEQKLIAEEVNDNVTDHLMSGVDVIAGNRGKQMISVRMLFLKSDPSLIPTHLKVDLLLEHLYWLGVDIRTCV